LFSTNKYIVYIQKKCMSPLDPYTRIQCCQDVIENKCWRKSNVSNQEWTIQSSCLFVCLFVWWCPTPLSTIFQLYRGGQFYWWRKPEDHRPFASQWQTLSHNVAHIPWSRFELTTSVVIGTDCIGSCKSNYHTITPQWPLIQSRDTDNIGYNTQNEDKQNKSTTQNTN